MHFVMYSHYNGLCFNRYLFVGKDAFDAYIHSLKNQKMEG